MIFFPLRDWNLWDFKKIILSIFMTFLILSSFMLGFGFEAQTKPTEKIRVLVGFRDKPDLDMIRAWDGDIKYVYNIISAMACSLPEKAINSLSKIPKIRYIEKDGIVKTVGEVLPWGVDRIDAEIVHHYNKGTGVKIAIIDTGIDYNHPDLDKNVAGGESFVDYTMDYMDDNGHGTHVAGIIAAEENEIGVVGVAPEAKLYALKALDSEGMGYLSDIIEAIEWSVDNGMQIISMSIGTNEDYLSLHAACNNAYAKGLLLIAAAGNDATNMSVFIGLDTIDYPARYDSVIAVGAIGSDDNRASWSSTGEELELVAPGVNIYSTYFDDEYETISGTSMACPHVTGVAALVFKTNVSLDYDLDRDGAWDASEVRKKLKDTADDLGNPGWDPLYGFGLVDADEAASVDTTPPVISSVTSLNITSSTAKIIWTTDELSDSVVNYGTTTALGFKMSDAMIVTSHSITLTGLESGITYYYEVQSTDLSGNTEVDNNRGLYYTFTTLRADTRNTMHIGSIELSKRTIGMGRYSFTRAVALVTILDSNGNLVEGAKVYGYWSGLAKGKVYGVTDSNGRVQFNSRIVRSISGTFTFTVYNVIKDGWIYDSGANEETSNSI